MPEYLVLVRLRKTIEMHHDRLVKLRDVAVPNVARYIVEKDVGVAAFDTAHHRHFRNGMALTKIFAQEKRVDPRGVAAHDRVLVIVGKNLRLDEITWA